MEEIKASLERYVKHKIPTGSFLRAVLENNLSEAFGRADLNNRHRMFDIISYIYNDLPSVCWGSPEKVDNWLNRKEEESNDKEI